MKPYTIQVKQYTFHAQEYGDSKYPTFVCFHGMTSDGYSFYPMIDACKEKVHIILLDLPGHGETVPFETEEEYRFSSIVHLLKEALVQITKKNFVIIGHSWGGDLALHFAKHYPDLIKGIVLLDGGYVFPEFVKWSLEESLSGWSDYMDNSVFSNWAEIENEYAAYISHTWNENHNNIIQSNFIEKENQYFLKAEKFSILATIKAFYNEPATITYTYIKCPVLLFHATVPDNDPSQEKALLSITNSLDDITVIGLPNTKHNVHWDESYKVMHEVLEWMGTKFI